MKRSKSGTDEIERRLFEFSLGPLRLLDTTLDKLGRRRLATLLRDIVTEWRAYPSLTVYSKPQLRAFAERLKNIAGGLRKGGDKASADLVGGIASEILSWAARQPR